MNSLLAWKKWGSFQNYVTVLVTKQPGAWWEQGWTISSAGRLVAGVGKHNDKNKRLPLCLFPEMCFHSLRCVYTDLSAHTLPLQDQSLYKGCRNRASGLELLYSVENTNDSRRAALHVGDFPVLKSLFRRCDGTIPK